ncbi:hypothetical protein HCN51_27370 [Nonomuraea sp. FMUSA5-5]|uniref:Uncharacterized protein n=1 Tax=Nonomuraea composti TaxID=2720023 RepID=A0ABX1B8G4_9ACTN|nr:hypothetical protein [Nonomuraea sp. FMUSA5-5]NJP93122.1 hypothetical protein [Nonomuraea sp. FMUSA5-5]
MERGRAGGPYGRHVIGRGRPPGGRARDEAVVHPAERNEGDQDGDVDDRVTTGQPCPMGFFLRTGVEEFRRRAALLLLRRSATRAAMLRTTSTTPAAITSGRKPGST